MKDNDDIKQSITNSLDGGNEGLYPFFSYLLQDIWEIGASPDVILSIIKKNIPESNQNRLKIVDLGCGKGAVSIKLAKELQCSVLGIDAYSEFIKVANKYTEEHDVKEYCEFLTGDIRTKIIELKDYDVAILGSISPIFGNFTNTLKRVKECIIKSGFIIWDDAYYIDKLKLGSDEYLSKNELLDQINESGFKIVDEYIYSCEEMKESNTIIYDFIENRAAELIKKFPEQKRLFEDYLEAQRLENDVLENQVKNVTWLLAQK